VEKTPIYIFSTFGSKINEFERKKLEKNRKIPKTLKLQAITLEYNSHKFFQIFHLENQNNQLLLLPFLQTAEDRKYLEVVDIKKILVPSLLIYIYLHCVRRLS
jgi:hypothetical protein